MEILAIQLKIRIKGNAKTCAKRINKYVKRNASKKEMRVYNNALFIGKFDIDRLKPTAWLNDNIINLYTRYSLFQIILVNCTL